MSRIGKKPILIPENVEVKIEEDKITIKGPKGELSHKVRPEIEVEKKEGAIILKPKKEGKKTKSFWGLERSLLANMVKGVSEGFEKKLIIEGLGYRALLENDELLLQVGFSHPVKIKAPEGISFSVDKNIITVFGIDKQLVGQVSAKIRKVRPPEPYKGTGIRYLNEVIRRKLGKKAVAGK